MNELTLNEILVQTLIPETSFKLTSPLYDIESSNATKATIQATTTAEGNRFAVQKTAVENTVETLVAEGQLELNTSTVTTESRQVESLLLVTFKE